MDRRSSLSNRFSLSTSNISSPIAESTHINGSSVQSKFPWGGKMNSSQMSPNTNSIQRSVQKISVSPLKIGLIDPRVYTDAQSKGLASRVVKYHENSKKVNRSLSVGNLYNKPGQFPVVHLKKTEVHCANRRNKNVSMVKIAPPEKSVFQANTRTSILRTGSVVPTVYLQRADEKHSRENEPILLPAENDLTPTRSVLDALKEISRKRINNDDLEDATDGIKKYCKESDGASVSYNSSYNPIVAKRQREPATSPNSKKNSIEQVLKKRMYTKNNDITSSLSSSLTINTPKRKLCEINKGGQFSERLSPSDISIPPHAKQPCNEINKVFKETAISSNFVDDAITPLPPTPQEENTSYTPLTKTVSVPAILIHSQKPKLTLFNKDYGDVSLLKSRSEIIQSHNSPKSDDEEGLEGISFVKPRKKSPLLAGNNEALKRVRETKLSLMLSCLSGEPQEETDDVDSIESLNSVEKQNANTKANVEYTPVLPKYNEPKANIQLNGFTNPVVSTTSDTKTLETTTVNTSITFTASPTPVTASNNTTTNTTSSTLVKSPISTSGFTFGQTKTESLTNEKTITVTSTTASVVIPANTTTSSNVLQTGNSNFTFGKTSELTTKSDNTSNSTEKTSLLAPSTSTSSSLLKPITSGGFSFGVKPAVSTINPPSFGVAVSAPNTTISNFGNVSQPNTGDTNKTQTSEGWFGGNNPVSSTVVTTSTLPAIQTVSPSVANTQVSVFGALSSSAPIMSTSIFSQTSPTSAFNPVAPSTTTSSQPATSISFAAKTTTPVFGSQSATTPVFGSQNTTTPAFGTQNTTAPAFGSQTTTTPVFGSQPTATPVFGSQTTVTPVFGSQSATTPVFGSNSPKTATPAFGSGTSVGNSFNTIPTQQQIPSFGTATTQQQPSSTTPVPFSNAKPAFGTATITPSTGFGANNPPSFGALSGQTANPPSTGSTSIFGNAQGQSSSNNGFSFTGNSSTTPTAKTNLFENKIADNPSSFAFGGSQLQTVTPTTTIATASFNFAQQTPTTSSTSTFTAAPFAFGVTTTAPSTGTQSNSTFVFGGSSAINNKPDPNQASFNFAQQQSQTSSSGFAFGNTTNNNNNNTAVVKPTPFAFGNTNNPPNADSQQQQSQNTPFAFSSQNTPNQKPGGFAFNLGGVPENKNPFGAASSSTTTPVSNQNASFSNSFAFGGASSTNDPKPAIPSFFGGANNNNSSNQTFGTLAAGNTNNQSKPFAFGGGAGSTSTNLFGSSASNNNNNNNNNNSNVVSPFGGNTTAINQNQNNNSQPFSFGSNMTSPQGNSASNSSTPFAFGGSSTSTKVEQTSKPFNFSKPQQQPPANLFASPPLNTQPAFNFVAGNPNTDPNNGFNTQPAPTNLFAVAPTPGAAGTNVRGRPIRIANRRLNNK